MQSAESRMSCAGRLSFSIRPFSILGSFLLVFRIAWRKDAAPLLRLRDIFVVDDSVKPELEFRVVDRQ
jgi:hypothetical protein